MFAVLRFICWALFCISSSFLLGQNKAPNVVLILADDLGYGDLSCYGHEEIRTPHIDQLAKEGLRFTNFYSASPLCSPSRAALLTGRTPYRTGIKSWIPQNEDIFLHQEEKTIATLLQAAGYQTFLSGKWHLNGGLDRPDQPQPDDHGFDKWTALHAFAIPNHKNPTNIFEDGRALGKKQGYTADIFVDKALEYLEQRDEEKPFFLYLPMAEPHSEIASPPAFTDRYAAHTNGEIDLENLSRRGPGEYYANITYMDHQIGRVLAYLKEEGLSENTIVLFMSDNGPVTEQWRYWYEVNLYGNTNGLRGRKADLYEGGIKVPFIVKYPGKVADAQVSDIPVHGYDIVPTLCGLLGIPIPGDRPLDGVDMSAVFDQKELKREDPLFWAFETRVFDDPTGYHYALRDENWKLITNKKLSQTLLYDLSSDPYEVRDLSQAKANVKNRLLGHLSQQLESIANDSLRPDYQRFQDLTLLYTNDIESVYDPIDAYWMDSVALIGGIPQLATLIEQVQAREPLHFLFDAGDIFTGALSKVTLGDLPFSVYSDIGYDAMAIGNHEFEYGWPQLLKGINRARFPVLNANIYYEGTTINYGKPFTVVEKQGLRIGVIGVMGEEAFYNTIYKGNREGLVVKDPIPIVQKWVDELRPSVDMIVVLTHQNKSAPMQSDKEVDEEVQRGFDEDYEMAGKVKGIDVILGGHSDNGLWEPVQHPKTGTLIGITFGQGKQLGYMKLRLDKEKGGVQLLAGKLIPVISNKLLPQAKISKKIARVREEHPELTEVIGFNEETGYRKYYRESNLGNFIADAFRLASGADIGMINPGAIRADLDQGAITVEEIINIYPFLDELEVLRLKGTQLKRVVEYSLGLNYGLMQFSGLRLTYDGTKAIGRRLIFLEVNGQPVQEQQDYTLATTSFVARGGDGFSILTEGEQLTAKRQSVKQLLKDYIKAKKKFQLPRLGRQLDISLGK